MGSVARSTASPLSGGFYTVPEAVRLIKVGNEQRIRGWLQGYPDRPGPILLRDYQPIDKRQELSFLDLMEVRFVEQFREAGVKMRSLRHAALRLREEFNLPHPFASDRVVLVADRADVFVEQVLKKSAEEEGDRTLLSLLTNNYTMYEAIKESLLPGVRFQQSTRLAKSWAPRPDEFPEIEINPLIAYGQPAIPEGVPTSVLYDDWRAENEDFDAVAYWHKLPTLSVKRAVEFENEIHRRH